MIFLTTTLKFALYLICIPLLFIIGMILTLHMLIVLDFYAILELWAIIFYDLPYDIINSYFI